MFMFRLLIFFGFLVDFFYGLYFLVVDLEVIFSCSKINFHERIFLAFLSQGAHISKRKKNRKI